MTDRELMQQALDLLDDINQCSLPPTGIPLPAEIDHVMEALRARLAQPEQEPVAWHDPEAYGNVTVYEKWANENGWLPLYTAPPQREWQGLTDEEILEEYRQSYGDDGNLTDVYFAHAIEAKLKEKNT